VERNLEEGRMEAQDQKSPSAGVDITE
jgi:hypothetical protein